MYKKCERCGRQNGCLKHVDKTLCVNCYRIIIKQEKNNANAVK